MNRVLVPSAAVFDALPPLMGFISARFRLTAEADGALLQQAVNDCLTLYPVFGWHLERENGGAYLTEGPGSVPVYQGKCLLLPSQEDPVRPLVTVGFYKNTVFFSADHRICDGQGAQLFFGGILKRYSARLTGEAESVTGPAYDPGLMIRQTPCIPISVPEGYVPKERWGDPYLFPAMSSATRYTSRVFAVDEEAFMRYVRAKESSPTAVMHWLAAKGLYMLQPGLSKDITGTFIINTRKLTGMEQSVANSLGYGQLSVSREEMSRPETVKALKQAARQQMDPDRLRWYMLHPEASGAGPATFMVSYMRDQTDWHGLVQDHIAVYSSPIPAIEARSYGGRFEFMVDSPEGVDGLYEALKLAAESEGFSVFGERSVTAEYEGRRLHFSDIL